MSGAAFSPLACCIVAFENVVRRDEASLVSTGLREHDDAWYKRQRDERRSIPNPAGGVIHVARVHRAPRLSALWLLSALCSLRRCSRSAACALALVGNRRSAQNTIHSTYAWARGAREVEKLGKCWTSATRLSSRCFALPLLEISVRSVRTPDDLLERVALTQQHCR